MSRKALQKEMKFTTVKRSPDRPGANDGSVKNNGTRLKGARINEERNPNFITSNEKNKFFISKKEREVLNALDNSPVAPSIMEIPMNDWDVR